MITKIKQMMQISDDVSALSTQLTDVKKSILDMKSELATQRKEFDMFRKDFSSVKSTCSDLVDSFRSLMEDVHSAKDEFMKEISDFKVKKSQMHKEMLAKTDGAIQDELDKLRTDVSRYNGMKREVDALNTVLASLRSEIDKFRDISSRIKATDFEATKFAKKVFDADRDKLRLLKEIDTLQRMVGRKRRERNQSHR